MNKRQKILLFLVVTFFISCSKDDSAPPTPEINISGDWVLTNHHFEGTRRILSDNDINTISFSATAWELNLATTFSEVPNDYKSVGFYNIDIIVIDENGDDFFFSNTINVDDIGTWSRNNSFLGITIDGELRQASISVLNDTTLRYVISSNTNETDENNQNVSIFRTDFFTFTRQSN